MTPLAMLLLTAIAAAQSPEHDAIRRVLAGQQAAWNRADVRAFMTGYENSSGITFVGRSVTRGYEGVLASYIARYPTPEKMGHLTFSEIEINLLPPGAAYLIGRFQLARPADAGGDASGRFTLVLRKTASGWKIIHDHTS